MSKKTELCQDVFASLRHAQILQIQSATAILAVVGFLANGPDAWAQDDADDAALDKGTIEEIVVTGSRIKRRDFNTPSPLTTISSDDIAFSGQATIEETLNQMPQVLPLYGRTSNNPGDGTAEVNLRGIGPDRTLVLLNGRRVAPSRTGNSVDLNNIPEFLIDRIEIISGGASAVYGSDAIAGVINFITKQDFSGVGIEVGASVTDHNDAETYDLNLAFGHNFANGRGNVSAYANFFERKEMFAADREFTRIAYWDDWAGNLVPGGAEAVPGGHIFTPADLGNGPVEVMFNPDGTLREYVVPDDTYNYQPVNYLQVPLTRYAGGVIADYDVSDRFEGYLEASYIRSEPSQNLAPVPAYFWADINLDNPLLRPEARQVFADNYTCAPNIACFYIGKRLLEVGPRIIDGERDYSRVVAGIRGELWEGWDIDGWLIYTKEDSTDYLRNDVSETRLLQGLLVDPVTNQCFDPTGGCVPLNIFGEGNLSAEGVEFIRFADFQEKTERTQKVASVFITGSPVDTWAGSLDVAIGAEWRSDDAFFKTDEGLFLGDTLGYRGSVSAGIDGSEEVTELYAEAVVPLASDRAWADYLGVEVGARYSDYKLAGGLWTYKAGAEWQPFESLRLRAMHQRSTRAPNMGELFEEQSSDIGIWVAWDPIEDPCTASADPVANGMLDRCVMQGLPAGQVGVFEAAVRYPVTYIEGGNPNLEPEDGETWTAGAVISPETLPNWTFTVDYFWLEITDTIGSISSEDICFDSVNTAGLFCENIVRDATGNTSQITSLTSNRGLKETEGIDTQISFAGELPEFLGFGDHSASLNLNLYWTHMLTNKDQENPATEVFDCAGYFGWPCNQLSDTFPEDRVTTNIHYATGPLGLHLTWRWIEGTDNAAPMKSYIWGVPEPDLAVPMVDDENYLDAGLSYAFTDNFTLRGGVNNLLDTDPPQMADAVWSNNTDTGLYDVFGRSYYLTLSAHF